MHTDPTQRQNNKGQEALWLAERLQVASELPKRAPNGPAGPTVTVPRRGRLARLVARLVRDERGSVGSWRPVAAITPKRFANGRRIHVDHVGHSWRVAIQFGPGAGYVTYSDDRSRVLVRGRTLFLAHRSGSLAYAKRHRPDNVPRNLFGWELGLTRNGNRCPYVSH